MSDGECCLEFPAGTPGGLPVSFEDGKLLPSSFCMTAWSLQDYKQKNDAECCN